MTPSGAFIFDMDGTLVDNMRFHERTWIDLLAGCGLPVTVEEFHRRAAGRTNPDILREFLGDRLSPEELLEWAQRKEAQYRDAYRPHLRALDGLHDFLTRARERSIPMALATSGNLDNIEFVLQGLDIAHLFDAVVSGDEVERGKPDPEMFLLAASRLGVAPEGCVVFEDSAAGIEAAHRAGMRTVVLCPPSGSPPAGAWSSVEQVVPDYTGLRPEALLPAHES